MHTGIVKLQHNNPRVPHEAHIRNSTRTAKADTPMDTTNTRFGSGQSVRRIEDDKLLQGLGQYTDDITNDSTYAEHVRLCFLRSPYPHARIVSVDKSAALAMPGVVAVHCGADLVAAAAAALDAAGLADLEREADAELAPFRTRMAPDAYAQSRRAALDRLVRLHFGLPDIGV